MPSATSLFSVPLSKPLRTQLENTVKAARDWAETAARAALAQLAVTDATAPDYLSETQRVLRRKLRAHARSLSVSSYQNNSVETRQLVWEVAYEHWHRMLFARFLAESGLLMWEPGAAVSLDDCRDMVDNHPDMAMGAKSQWELAGKLAARMLPQVFKPQSPVFEMTFAPEHQLALEKLLAGLPTEVFQASDSLGWVYQFWQAKRKDEVNASEVKIGADELSAVTQLFTEPYMVDFLLHNSLGAWWTTRHPGQPCPVPLTYLRTVADAEDSLSSPALLPLPLGEGRGEGPPDSEPAPATTSIPAAGKFEGWPDTLKDFKLLDPCCGSGHFLVAAFLLLVPMRMATEGLSAMDAVDAVLRDNLHGLELDARCVEIAVFALALTAWRFPDEDGNALGVRADMPAPHIACCGLKVAAKADDWAALVPDSLSNKELLAQDLRALHGVFSQAPLLGSLLDPVRSLGGGSLGLFDFDALKDLLERALATEAPATQWSAGSEADDARWDLALTARGLLEAAQLLEARYHLVITNVPYVGQLKYSERLKAYILSNWLEAKSDLALAFTLRCQELLLSGGVSALVLPQGWLTQTQDEKFRKEVLTRHQIRLASNLGRSAFTSSIGQQVMLLILEKKILNGAENCALIDATSGQGPDAKAKQLINATTFVVRQNFHSKASKSQILFSSNSSVSSTLGQYADCLQGLSTGEKNRFERVFWEISLLDKVWDFLHETGDGSGMFGGMQAVIRWEQECGQLSALAEELKHLNHAVQSWRRGKPYWGRLGIVINRMGSLNRKIYMGDKFSADVGVISPKRQDYLLPVAAFLMSKEFLPIVRSIYQKPEVPPSYLVNIPFDFFRWKQVAEEVFPQGLPKPYSDDPTQWLFHGHPQPATDPLQVAVARLAGYRWPAELDAAMELAPEARAWISRCDALLAHADDDGIVCLPPVRGEKPAAERLLHLLIAAWETSAPGSWKPGTLDTLLAGAGCAGKGLDVWLRELFFEQHAKRFQHRPFIWQVWDGLKDGFAALVNYHRLDAKNLERLIHTYLGDWIRTQEAGVASGIDGAPLRLAAAQQLKTRLQAILDGEKPYDIFVRWKPLAGQPIGWNPDLNDGVRLNIRPFMAAEVLRHNKKPKLNITWDKDRGKDVESAPWFKVFGGERINDHHLTLAEKQAARAK